MTFKGFFLLVFFSTFLSLRANEKTNNLNRNVLDSSVSTIAIQDTHSAITNAARLIVIDSLELQKQNALIYYAKIFKLRTYLSDAPRYFLRKTLKDTFPFVKQMLNEKYPIKAEILLSEDIASPDSIIAKPPSKNKNLNYYIIFLGVLTFLMSLILKPYYISNFKKAHRIMYFFANTSNRKNTHLKIESHILLLFYFLNLSLFLYLLVSRTDIPINFLGKNYLLLKIFVIVVLYNVGKYYALYFIGFLFHALWTTLQYRMNVIYKELLGVVYFIFNALIILNTNPLSNKAMNIYIVAFFIIYVLKKTALFVATKQLIKKNKVKHLTILFVSEYGVLSLIIYFLLQLNWL